MTGRFYSTTLSKKSRRNWVCFVLLLLIWGCAHCCYSTHDGLISTKIKSKGNEDGLEYIAEVWIGTPRKQMFCNIDFSHGNVVMFTSLKWSKSYSEDGRSPTEVLEISNKIFRVKITYPTSSDESRMLCKECTCVLGFGKNSPIWNIWTGATFTRSQIQLGTVNKYLKNKDPVCNHVIVKCDVTESAFLCGTEKASLVGTKIHPLTNAVVSKTVIPEGTYKTYISATGHSYLPRDLYNKFFDGSNIYNNLPQIDLTFVHQYDIPKPILEYTNIQTAECPENTTVTLEDEKLIMRDGFGRIRSHILPTDETNDTIILGVHSWINLVVYYDNVYSFVVLESATSSISYSYDVVTLVFILYVIFVRSKLSSCSILFDLESELDYYYVINIFFECLPIPLTLSVFFLDHVKYLMKLNTLNHTTFIIYIVMYSVAVATTIYFVLQMALQKGGAKNPPSVKRYIFSLWNQFFHDLIVLTGMWILLTQTNTEVIHNFFTFIVQILLLFSIMKHTLYICMIFSVFQVSMSENVILEQPWNYFSLLIMTSFVFSLGFLGVISTFGWIAFFNPFLASAADHLEVNVNILTVNLFLAVLLCVFYLSHLRMIKSFVQSLSQITQYLTIKEKSN